MNFIYSTIGGKIAAWDIENMRKLRKILIGACSLGGIVGMLSLPFLGFGSMGVAAGSIAAAIQSSIGNVAAGSMFAVLQSWGASGLGAVYFGLFGTAISLLVHFAVSLF